MTDTRRVQQYRTRVPPGAASQYRLCQVANLFESLIQTGCLPSNDVARPVDVAEAAVAVNAVQGAPAAHWYPPARVLNDDCARCC